MSEKSSTKQIIKAHGALLKAAESTPITRKILEAYRHTVKYSTNIKAINHTKFSLPQLEKCLQFLKLQTRGTKEEAIYTNKATAADRIILMIESYFPSRCQDCEEVYTNTLTDDTPYPFTCFLCLQGAHSCDESLQRKDKSVECAFNNPVWLCDGCYTKNDLSTPDNPKRTRHPSQCAVTFQGVDKDDPPQDPKVTELAVAAATAAAYMVVPLPIGEAAYGMDQTPGPASGCAPFPTKTTAQRQGLGPTSYTRNRFFGPRW